MVGPPVAADPDEAARIGIKAMLGLGPVVALAGAAPALQEIAVLIEFEHRRCRLAFRDLVFAHAARALQDPGVALRVDGDARHLAPDPSARQLRPARINLEAWKLLLLRGRRRPRAALQDQKRRG